MTYVVMSEAWSQGREDCLMNSVDGVEVTEVGECWVRDGQKSLFILASINICCLVVQDC